VYFAVFAYFPFSSPLDVLFTLLSYCFFVGLYTGLAACLSCALMRSGSALLCWGGVPALWVSGEFARSSLFSGFSWELLGYTQYRHLTFVQITDITGVYGLSFLMALSGYVAAETLRSLRLGQAASHKPQSAITLKIPWSAVGSLAVGVALVLLYGTMRLRQYPPTPPAPATIVALVRGEVPSVQRWNRVYYASSLLRYISITNRGIEGAQPDLVVWPEFAVGFYLDREPLLRAQLGQLTQKINASLLVGAPRMEESETGRRYYNSAYLISPNGKLVDVYDKIRLIPFAEYRPLTLPVLHNHSPEYPSEFTAGKRATIFPLPPQGAFGVMICYEATYPYLARHLVQDGAQFLINISNDIWLVKGGEAAAAQHFSMAVFRAVENRRSLARMAAAGISGFIDPAGRLDHLSAEEEGVVLGKVFPRQELTVYARYGDWFAWTCVGLACVALIRGRQRP
jgi:apolipoprotein N-acyltransferase